MHVRQQYLERGYIKAKDIIIGKEFIHKRDDIIGIDSVIDLNYS